MSKETKQQEILEQTSANDSGEIQPADYMSQLNEMAVPENVKEAVSSILKKAQLRASAKAMGIDRKGEMLHTLFKGNDTAKMKEVAGILGNIYKQFGILESGHIVECDRQSLVSEFVGQTLIKTQEVIDKARGGILFVDKADEVCKKGECLSREALDALLVAMDRHKDDLMVIFAGESGKIEEFVGSHSGIASRLSWQKAMVFED